MDRNGENLNLESVRTRPLPKRRLQPNRRNERHFTLQHYTIQLLNHGVHAHNVACGSVELRTFFRAQVRTISMGPRASSGVHMCCTLV
eukprot:563449-Pyramimonas_sp.AAC.1